MKKIIKEKTGMYNKNPCDSIYKTNLKKRMCRNLLKLSEQKAS